MFRSARHTFPLPRASSLHPLPSVAQDMLQLVVDPVTRTKGLISDAFCNTSPKFSPTLLERVEDTPLVSAVLDALDCSAALLVSVRVGFRVTRHPVQLHPGLLLNACFGREHAEVADSDVQTHVGQVGKYVLYVYVPKDDTVTMDVIMRMLCLVHDWQLDYGNAVLRCAGRRAIRVEFATDDAIATTAILRDPREPKVWDFEQQSLVHPTAESRRFAYDDKEELRQLPFYATTAQLVDIASAVKAEWFDVESPCACRQPSLSATKHVCWSLQDSPSHAAMLEAARFGDPEVEAELAPESEALCWSVYGYWNAGR